MLICITWKYIEMHKCKEFFALLPACLNIGFVSIFQRRDMANVSHSRNIKPRVAIFYWCSVSQVGRDLRVMLRLWERWGASSNVWFETMEGRNLSEGDTGMYVREIELEQADWTGQCTEHWEHGNDMFSPLHSMLSHKELLILGTKQETKYRVAVGQL